MNNKDMVELRECPFCGSGNIARCCDDQYEWGVCDDCGCDGPRADTEDEADEKWNTRTGVERLTGEVNCEEIAILHGQQVVVTFRDSKDAFDFFNEIQSRTALQDGGKK